MKTKLVFAFAFLILFPISIFARKMQGDTESSTTQYRSLKCNHMQSITSSIILKQEMDVLLEPDMGIVCVAIKNNRGIAVTQRRVDTATENNLQINIANLPKGLYTIIFSDKEGKTIKSERFKID